MDKSTVVARRIGVRECFVGSALVFAAFSLLAAAGIALVMFAVSAVIVVAGLRWLPHKFERSGA